MQISFFIKAVLGGVFFLGSMLSLCGDSCHEVRIAKKQKLKVLHISFHAGCIKDFEKVAKILDLDVTSWFILEDPRKFDEKFDDIAALYDIGHDRAERIWRRHRDYFNTFDLILTSDTAPLSRIFLQNGYTKPLVIWVCNRFDYYDAAHLDCDFPDTEYYALFKKATMMPNVRIVPYTDYEYLYAAKKGINIGTFTIKPLGYKESDFRESDLSYIPQHVDKKNSLFLTPRFFGCSIPYIEQLCRENNIPIYCGRFNGSYDLEGFKGILYFPYAWSTFAMFETLQRGLIQFVPSEKFMRELVKNGWQIHASIHSDFYSHYFKVSELYQEQNKPVCVYFDSWQDLREKSSSLDYETMRTRVLRFAEQHRDTVLSRWQSIFNSLCPNRLEYSDPCKLDSSN